MIVAAALILLVGGAPILPPPVQPPTAVVAVPDEPDALMLPEAVTYQAVAADVDGDGVRDVVRMVAAANGAIDVEAWRFVTGAGWQMAGGPVAAAPSPFTAEPGQLAFAGAPARLIVRRIDGSERATLVRQPPIEEAGLEVECCLLVHDVVVDGGRLELVDVAEPMPGAHAILAIDMDGDATDELLATRSLPPMGGITFPTDARVVRWTGDRFAPPVLTELLVGSGASPFILGDSDAIPGDEAAFIGAQERLHRISLREGDLLVAESAEVATIDAIAVPIGAGRGIATVTGPRGIEVRNWPRDAPMGAPVADNPELSGELLGVVTMPDGHPAIALEVSGTVRLPLPELTPITGSLMTPSARRVESGPLEPYVGMLPRGGSDGEPALLTGGELARVAGEIRQTATLAGVEPIGLVGPGKGWLALCHCLRSVAAPDSSGGQLAVPTAEPESGVSLVPFAEIRTPEADDAVLSPPVNGAITDRGRLLVAAAGFSAQIDAPAGSRVYVQRGGSRELDAHVVPASGTLQVSIQPIEETEPNPTYRPRLAVVTPGGRSYLATWSVTVLDQPPALSVRAETAFGSPSVSVGGETDPLAVIRVNGRAVQLEADGSFAMQMDLPPWPTEVEVVATDRIGNLSRVMVVGVGWFDYRALPWTAIAIVIVGIAGAILTLRAPKSRERPRPADGDGVLEEVDPEG